MSTMIQKNEVHSVRHLDVDKIMTSGFNGDLMMEEKSENSNNTANPNHNHILPLQQQRRRRPNHDDDQVVKLFESTSSLSTSKSKSIAQQQIPTLLIQKGDNDPHGNSSTNNNKILGPRGQRLHRRCRQPDDDDDNSSVKLMMTSSRSKMAEDDASSTVSTATTATTVTTTASSSISSSGGCSSVSVGGSLSSLDSNGSSTSSSNSSCNSTNNNEDAAAPVVASIQDQNNDLIISHHNQNHHQKPPNVVLEEEGEEEENVVEEEKKEDIVISEEEKEKEKKKKQRNANAIMMKNFRKIQIVASSSHRYRTHLTSLRWAELLPLETCMSSTNTKTITNTSNRSSSSRNYCSKRRNIRTLMLQYCNGNDEYYDRNNSYNYAAATKTTMMKMKWTNQLKLIFWVVRDCLSNRRVVFTRDDEKQQQRDDEQQQQNKLVKLIYSMLYDPTCVPLMPTLPAESVARIAIDDSNNFRSNTNQDYAMNNSKSVRMAAAAAAAAAQTTRTSTTMNGGSSSYFHNPVPVTNVWVPSWMEGCPSKHRLIPRQRDNNSETANYRTEMMVDDDEYGDNSDDDNEEDEDDEYDNDDPPLQGIILGDQVSDRPQVAFSRCGVRPVKFPPPENRQVYMLPFIMGDKDSLPEDLQPYFDSVIMKCPIQESEFGKVFYLTVYEGTANDGNWQLKSGLRIGSDVKFHSDPSFTPCATANLGHASGGWNNGRSGGGGRGVPTTSDQFYGGYYIASSESDTTRVWNALVDKSEMNQPGIEHLRPYLKGQGIPNRTLQGGELLWMTDRTPYECLQPSQQNENRDDDVVRHQFFRLVTSGISTWNATHSTHNPLVRVPDTVRITRQDHSSLPEYEEKEVNDSIDPSAQLQKSEVHGVEEVNRVAQIEASIFRFTKINQMLDMPLLSLEAGLRIEDAEKKLLAEAHNASEKLRWTNQLTLILKGTRDMCSPFSILLGKEDVIVRHIYEFLFDPCCVPVRPTFSAESIVRIANADDSIHRENEGRDTAEANPYLVDLACRVSVSNVWFPSWVDRRSQWPIGGNSGTHIQQRPVVFGGSIADRPPVAFSCLSCSVKFPPPRGRKVYMLPFVMGKRESLPDDLQPYHDAIIVKCPVEESQIGKVCFLTVYEGKIEPDSTWRLQTGLRVAADAVFRSGPEFIACAALKRSMNQLECISPDQMRGGSFVASSLSNTTRVWNALVDKTEIDRFQQCNRGDVEHLRPFMVKQGITHRTLQAGELTWMTDRTPYECLPQSQDNYHQFFRLVTSDVYLRDPDETTLNRLVPIPRAVQTIPTPSRGRLTSKPTTKSERAYFRCGGDSIQFPRPCGRNVYMLPFEMGNRESLPEILHPYFEGAIMRCPVPRSDYGKVFFLSIWEGWVEPAIGNCKTAGQNVLRIHNDAVFRSTPKVEARRLSETPRFIEGIYVATSQSNMLRIWDTRVDDSQADYYRKNQNGIVEDLRHGLIQDSAISNYELKAGELCWITDQTPYEYLPQGNPVFQQWFHLVSSDIYFWNANRCTFNPLVTVPLNVREFHSHHIVEAPVAPDLSNIPYAVCRNTVKFPTPTGRKVYMLPFTMGVKESLPDDLQPYFDTAIMQCPVPDVELGKTCYLTIWEGWMSESGSFLDGKLRVPSDVVLRSRDERHGGPKESTMDPASGGGIYLATSQSDMVRVWNSLVEIPRADECKLRSAGVVEDYLRPALQACGISSWTLQEGELVWMTDRTPYERLPHEPRMLDGALDRYVQWFYLVTSNILHWNASKSTVNPRVTIPAGVHVIENSNNASYETAMLQNSIHATSLGTTANVSDPPSILRKLQRPDADTDGPFMGIENFHPVSNILPAMEDWKPAAKTTTKKVRWSDRVTINGVSYERNRLPSMVLGMNNGGNSSVHGMRYHMSTGRSTRRRRVRRKKKVLVRVPTESETPDLQLPTHTIY